MRDRASRVRARSTTGTFLLGNLEKSQRGRPQGGFLSPILTPLFLTLRENDVPVNEYWHDFKDLLYADAVSGKTIVPSREILRKLATLHLSRIRVPIIQFVTKTGWQLVPLFFQTGIDKRFPALFPLSARRRREGFQ